MAEVSLEMARVWRREAWETEKLVTGGKDKSTVKQSVNFRLKNDAEKGLSTF